jgi:plastocyanin
MRTVRTASFGLALLAASSAAAGDIRGTVRYAGPAPKLAPLEVVKDKATCGDSARDESLLVSEGRLQNAVLTVRGASARPAAGALVLDQQRCRYLPHVQAAAVGSTLEIRNGDPVLHNVHGYRGAATAFNVAMPQRDQKRVEKLDRPGLVAVRCDVHSWMTAYVVVTDLPFAVSGADGTFAIRGLAAGSYTLAVWHERLGERTAQVTVPASGEAAVDLSFGN